MKKKTTKKKAPKKATAKTKSGDYVGTLKSRLAEIEKQLVEVDQSQAQKRNLGKAIKPLEG